MSRCFPVVCAVGVLLYGVLMACFASPYATGSDSSGYLNSARLLARGELSAQIRPVPGGEISGVRPLIYQPLGFQLLADRHSMVPTYPVGVPLHLVAASAVVGWGWAPVAANTLGALAAGMLLYGIGRRLALPPLWAAGGVLLLWLCPLFLFSAMQPMSDLLALSWALATLYAALRADDDRWWAAVCGVCLGIAVLVRPTNVLLAVPVAVAFGFRFRRYVWLGLGGLPSAVWLAWYNRRLYGAVLTSGYGSVGELFAWANLPFVLSNFARWLPLEITPPVLAAALAAPFARAGRTRSWAVLWSWAVVLTGVYAFYYHSGETWWYLRFILPAYPVLILAAVQAAHCFAARRPPPAGWRVRPAVIVLGALALAVGCEACFIQQKRLLRQKNGERVYALAADWVRGNLPANAAVLCMQTSGTFYYYTDFTLVRWDVPEAGERERLLRALDERKLPVYAVLFPFELDSDALARYGGSWKKVAALPPLTIWQRQVSASGP